jgi:hypothetical protein
MVSSHSCVTRALFPQLNTPLALRDVPLCHDPAEQLDETDEADFDPKQFELFFGEQFAEAWKPREDVHLLEFPLSPLQKGNGTRVRAYRSDKQIVQIIPSVVSAASQPSPNTSAQVAALCGLAPNRRKIPFNSKI